MKTKRVFCLGGKDTMKKSVVLFCSSLTVMLSCAFSQAATIQGTVVNEKNMPVEGVMVSAIDAEHRKWTSVFTKPDGSFTIDGLRDCTYRLRTRLMGLADTWLSSVSANTDNLHIRHAQQLVKSSNYSDLQTAPSACWILRIHMPSSISK
jgi:hypothetical protein